MQAYSAGDYLKAIPIVEEWVECRTGTGDELMWLLEEGTIKFAAGDYSGSLLALEKAENIVKEFDESADLRVRDGGSEVGAAFTNPNALPYKGFCYDRILLNIYKALNYLGLGDKEGALVELRRVYEQQKKIEKRFEEDIAKADEDIKTKNEENKTGVTFESLLSSQEINESYQKLAEKSNKLYGNLVNPFATYLSAIGYLFENNYSEAYVDFKNLYKMDAANPLIQRDLVTCAKYLGQEIPDELSEIIPYDYPLNENIVFVIFENGLSPALKEVKAQIILPPPIGYTGIAYPDLEYFPDEIENIQITDSEGHDYYTTTIAEMDSIVSQEYRSLLPVIITRIAVSTLTKEVASYAAQRAVEASGAGSLAEWGTLIATSFYKYSFNTADTRCWQTLPKEYQIAHLPRPSDGRLEVKAAIGEFTNTEEILLKKDKKIAIIYVKFLGKGILSIKVFEFD